MNLPVRYLDCGVGRCGCERSREEAKFHGFWRAVFSFYFFYIYINSACKKHLNNKTLIFLATCEIRGGKKPLTFL